MMKEKFKKYCEEKKIKVTIDEDIVFCKSNSLRYKIVEDETLLNAEFQFLPELHEIEEGDFEGWVFEFAGRWYYHMRGEAVNMTEFIYIGKADQRIQTKSFLGIHSGYELMNAVGLYKDYLKKAKFLGIKSLGICEKNTLSGVLDFQQQCSNNNIKSIIGLSLSVRIKDVLCTMKLYAQNFQGWCNLLKFNSAINVDQELAIDIEFLKENRKNLFVIADPKSMPFALVPDFIDYYQLETVQYSDFNYDERYLNNLEKYLMSNLEPISITDSYYLEPEYHSIRETLWKINNVYEAQSENQYMKSKEQYAIELKSMFENDAWKKLFKKAVVNEKYVVDNCNFVYDTNTRHLPKYVMTEEQANQFKDNGELFLHLVKKGFKDRKIKNAKKYVDRLKTEIQVLKMGDVIDYFLSLHDILTYAHKEKLLTGIGRGSAGGSLVAYLMGLIQVDPLEFDLLFERFLNSGRMGEWQDRPLYIFEMEDGSEIKLPEGSLLRVNRDGDEVAVFVHEIIEGDDIVRY